MIRFLLLLFLILSVNSCAALLGIDRTFIKEMKSDEGPFFVAERDFQVIPGDSGKAFRSMEDIRKRTPRTRYEREQNTYQKSISEELVEKEEQLLGDELYRYNSNKKYLTSISEKLYYLGLSPWDRRAYIRTKFEKREDGRYGGAPVGLAVMRMNREIRPAVALGMDKGTVENVWGRPFRIDIAGNPSMQNERWLFYVGGRSEYVYFENGRVQGWSR